MRNLLWCVLLAWLCSGCAATGPGPVGPRTEALQQHQQALFDAIAARDAGAVAAQFADDAELQVAGMPPIRGREAIARFYGNLFGFLAASTSAPGPLQVAASGDLAFGSGSTVNTFDASDGAVSYAGKFVLVWQWIDGRWQVVRYAVSSNQPERARR